MDIGIDATRAEEIGRMALADPSTPSNAKAITAVDLENLFRTAVSGDRTLLLTAPGD